MRRQSPLPFAVIAAAFVLLAGCRPQEPFFIPNAKDTTLSHYKAVSVEIEYPNVDSDSLAEVKGAIEPFSIGRKQPKDFWDIKLEEVIQITLENNKIIRSIGGQVSPQASIDNIIRNPEAVSSIYDVALMESNPRSGVEAALSAFDTQWSTNVFWQRVDTPQNTGTVALGNVLMGDNANFVTQLQKINAAGGTSTIRHNVQYALSNQFGQIYPGINGFASDWNVNLELEARQPLLRGSGVQVNRITGPNAQPGQFNGVMLARINTDIALADFEAQVRNLVFDTEKTYWELCFYYRSLDALISGRDQALKTWQKVQALRSTGSQGGGAAEESQAREQYYQFKSTVEQTLTQMYELEARLRYLMGLAATDGRMIRPADEPTTASVSFDWYEISSEAMVRNVELRRIKFGVKNRELSLIASKNFLLPQVDLDALYRFRGLGNDLLSSDRQPGGFGAAGSSAYQSLTSGQFQEWQAGIIMQMPIGFRRELSGVRNAQLGLSKERAVLREAELEVSHLLATALRTMEADYVLSNTNFQRRIAAQGNVEAVAAAYDTGRIQIDVLLQAQRFLAQAESDYYRSLVNYNSDIAQVHYRKGSLLEYNGVYLAEGPWPGKAYFDARRRARARDSALYMDYGFTQPRVITQGPYQQHTNRPLFDTADQTLPGSETTQPETVPTPSPTPAPDLEDPGYNRKEEQPAPKTPPAPPVPDATAAVEPVKTAKPATEWKVAAGSKTSGRKTHDIGSLQLNKLEDNPIKQTSATEPVKHKEPVLKVPQNSSQLQWSAPKQTKQNTNDESIANPSTLEPDRPTSGWQGVQR